jgi:fermentation-respiration switch protein FrsA (DUF1100 family)
MATLQPPEHQDAAAAPPPTAPAPASRGIWYWVLRLCVPVPRGKTFRSKAGWVGRRVVSWYLIILCMLAFFQRSLIYQPTRESAIDPIAIGLEAGRVEKVAVPTADGLQLNGWVVPAFPPPRNGQAQRLAVIYFPGNAGHRAHRGLDLDQLSRMGVDAYLVDYRGYADNPGKPTETNFAADAQAIWKFVTGTRQVPASHVVLLGESLGGGVATRLASELSAAGTPPGGLILRSTFSSLVDVAAFHYSWLPVRWVLLDRYPSIERIKEVTCPILVLHGTVDTIIPFDFAKRLFAAAPDTSANLIPKKFVALPGADHNDIAIKAREPYRAAVREFLDRIQAQASVAETSAKH